MPSPETSPIRNSDFNTAMIHFYRGELSRSNAWRARLDTTTNWAVVSTGAALTFTFGSPDSPALVLIISTLLVLLFLFIEARRYRYYELWANRVRLLEQNYFSPMLTQLTSVQDGWENRLADSLNAPRFSISLLEAVGRRYRRNYAPIFLILGLSWVAKIYLHPVNARNIATFLERAAIGAVPGTAVLTLGIVVHLALLCLGLFTIGLQAATGEVFSETTNWLVKARHLLRLAVGEVLETELPRLPHFDARKQLVYIISDHVEIIGQALLADLHRGVTLLHGTGMYTGKEHGVLMCALQAKQVAQLKAVVQAHDAAAFIIVMPVQGIHGTGFRPLEA